MFVQLTGKSVYSPTESTLQIEDIVDLAVKYEMSAVGLTDDNNTYALFKFYKACKKAKIKPIVGVTLNVCMKPHTIHEDNPISKIHLLVKDLVGYKNLNTIITIAQTEGRETGESSCLPKILYSDIFKYSEGLICLTGGYEGLWNNAISTFALVQNTEWEDILLEFQKVFKEDFYIEIQDHSVSSELEVNVELLKLHQKHNIKIVLTHNYLYKDESHSFSKEVLRAIKNGGTVNRDLREYVYDNFETIDFANDMKFKDYLKDGNQFGYKTSQEMESHNLVKFFPQLLTNITEIIDNCNLKLNLDNPEMPDFPLPEGFSSNESYFRKLVDDGFEAVFTKILKRRDLDRFPTEEEARKYYQFRLDYEKDMITQMGFPGYFLVVWDVCRYAYEENIPMAPGRGSVAGSLVAYCLRITGIDPIAKDLLFERFLNPARVSMPDIDLDFDSQFRTKILDYTYKKYGYDFVAQIIAFTNLTAKPAVKDVGKVLNLYDESIVPSTKYNDFTDHICKFLDPKKTIRKTLDSNPELYDLYQSSKKVKFLLDIAMTVENSIKSTSMHAGGIVIGKSPIANFVPSQKAKIKKSKDDSLDEDEEAFVLEGVVIQADKKACEPLGLIKMDYLSTAILKKIRITLASVNMKLKVQGKKLIDFYELCDYVQYVTTEEDPAMYKVLQEGNSLMVFQCENPALGNVLTQFYPETFEDVTAILALYRPGPMANIPTYIANKNNPNIIDFMHDDLISVLKETYGIIVYQEQIMQLVQVWAGFSLAEADLIRRAIGKKEEALLVEEGIKFVTKAVAMGRDEQLSKHLYDLIVRFADYGFNKSHAAAYAVLALVTAWLKAYYPLEYVMCSINSFSTSAQKPVERISNYIYNIQDMGFEVLPPDVNNSNYLFSIENNKLRHGLFAIKDVQERSAKVIFEEREKNGTYKDFHDFMVRNARISDEETKKEGYKLDIIDKSTIQSLTIVNAFHGISNGLKNSEMYPEVEKMVDFYKKQISNKEKRERSPQLDLFAGSEDFSDIDNLQPYNYPSVEKDFHWSFILENELSKMKISYQVDFSKHMDGIKNSLVLRNNFDNLSFTHAGQEKKPHLYENKELIVCYGAIRAKRKINLKNGGEMCFITFRDHTGIIESTLFSEQYKKYKNFIDNHENSLLVFKGTLQQTVYGKTNHESKVYNMNIEDVYTLEEINRNPSQLFNINASIQDVETALPPKQQSSQRLSEVSKKYKFVHIKISNDMNLKQTLKTFFVSKNHSNKNIKILIHNYEDNIKKDVVFVDNYNLSIEDINELIATGIVSKRNVFLPDMVIVE